MSLQHCLLVAQLPDAAERSVAETRMAQVARAFGDLGAPRSSIRLVEGMRLLAAVIDLAGEHHDLEGVVSWGKGSQPDMATPEALLSAPDVRLRELPTPLAAVAFTQTAAGSSRPPAASRRCLPRRRSGSQLGARTPSARHGSRAERRRWISLRSPSR